MRRRVQALDRAMVHCVVQVRLDGDLLAGYVSDIAAVMSAIEIVEDGAPCLGIAFLIGKTADRAGDHAVNYSLVVVGICPPGTCSIPGHGRRIVRPGHSAGNHASGNTEWRKRGFEQGGRHAGGCRDRKGELSARQLNVVLLLYAGNLVLIPN